MLHWRVVPTLSQLSLHIIYSEIVISVCRWHAEILGWEDYTNEQVVTPMNDLLHFGFKTDCKNCTMVFIELCLLTSA